MENDSSPPNNGYGKSYDSLAISIVVSALLVLMVALVFVVLFALAIKIYSTLFWQESSSQQHRSLDNTAANDGNDGVRTLEMAAAIRAMPVFKYSASMKTRDGAEATECAVCLCEFEENDSARLLPQCKHIFHTQCIDMWFSSHSNCPLCRANLLPIPSPSPSPSPDPSPDPNPEHNDDVVIINVHVVHNPS